MSNNNIVPEKNKENETILSSLDKLYEFLYNALCNDNIYDAIRDAEEQGVSTTNISIVARRLLENYDDLAKVKELRKKNITYLIIRTHNTEFTTKLYEAIAKFDRERISKKSFHAFELENPQKRVLFELSLSRFNRSLSDILREVAYPNHDWRTSEACKNKQPSDYDKTIKKILEETNNDKEIQKILENTQALLFNDWYGEDIFGKPTPREINITTTYLAHPGIKKYVLRHYKNFLQSSWKWYDSTEWSDLKGEELSNPDYARFKNRVINFYLDKKGWTINDEGELISLKNNKPIRLDISFPSAINMKETHSWLWAYGSALNDIKRLILDEWDKDIFGGKQPEIWKIRHIISDTKHPGIMKYALKKYQKELIDYNLYDKLCEEIAKVESNLENYEHLINLYNTVLADNNIDIEALTAELETTMTK